MNFDTNSVPGFAGAALKIARLFVVGGMALVLISLLLMMAFNLYDLWFGPDVTTVDELFKSMTPTWRMGMFITGCTLVALGACFSVIYKVSSEKPS